MSRDRLRTTALLPVLLAALAFGCSRPKGHAAGGPADAATPTAAPAAAAAAPQGQAAAPGEAPAASATTAPTGSAPADSAGAVPAASGAAGTAAQAPATLPPYEVRLGRDVYIHYCQTCHGDTGAGDGFNAYNLDPHPRDLSDPEFQKKTSDADLRDAIQRGGAGVGLSPLMPPWGHTLSPRQIDAVILYLRSLRRAPS